MEWHLFLYSWFEGLLGELEELFGFIDEILAFRAVVQIKVEEPIGLTGFKNPFAFVWVTI